MSDTNAVEVRVPDESELWEYPAQGLIPTEIAPATDESESESVEKRYRATKAEMEAREKAAVRFLQQAPTTINKLSKETGLPHPKAQALIRRLINEGRVTTIGADSENGRKLYKLDPKVTEKPVRKNPAVSFANFLDHFHLGQELKVVGLHITDAGSVVDVQVDGQIIRLQTAQ